MNQNKYQKEAGGVGGSAFSSLAQTGGGGGLTFWTLGGLEVNIGDHLQNDLTLKARSPDDTKAILYDLIMCHF
jgi:hypothetical protein